MKFFSLFITLYFGIFQVVHSENIQYYDKIPELDELRHHLLGTSAAMTNNVEAPIKRRTRTRSLIDSSNGVSDVVPDTTNQIPSINTKKIIIGNIPDSDVPSIPSLTRPTQTAVLAFPINFDLGSAKLKADAFEFLDAMGQLMKTTKIALLIEGHTDAVGQPTTNLRLSRDRAYAVVNYLVDEHNINPSRLSAMGAGSSRPLTGEDENSKKNRRVQFRVREI